MNNRKDFGKQMKKQYEWSMKMIYRFFMAFLTAFMLASNLPVYVRAETGELSYSNEQYKIILTYDEASGIPDGSTLQVEEFVSDDDNFDDYADKTKEILEWQDDAFGICSLLNIYILDSEGNVVIPQNKVRIKVQMLEEEDEEKVYDIDETHLVVINDEESNLNINNRNDDAVAKEDANVSIDFSASSENASFPVVALAQSVKEKVVKTSDDQTYVIRVTYDADSGIPIDAEIEVEEVDFADYAELSADALDTSEDGFAFAYAFDIRIVDPESGEEYQPNNEVKVSIELLKEDLSDQKEVEVVHIPNDPEKDVEVLKADINDETVEFKSDGFSVYVVVRKILEETIETSDGETYIARVVYDERSGIPQDARLIVSEIAENSSDYDRYVNESIEKLAISEKAVTFAKAFDIRIVDPLSGEEYQPNNSVSVSIRLLDDSLSAAEEVGVVHFGAETERIEATINDETIRFESDGFSVYVVIGSDGSLVTPTHTYTFYIPDEEIGGYKEYAFIDDEGDNFYTQSIKNADELIVPFVTSTDSKEFAGWYEGEIVEGQVVLQDKPYDFDNIEIIENRAISLYAVYDEYVSVIFHDQYDGSSFPLAYTRRVLLSGEEGSKTATVKISDLSIIYNSTDDSQMAFLGWSYTAVEEAGVYADVIVPDEDGCITVDKDTDLYPIFKEIYWLTYYSAQSGLSASYIAPAYYYVNDPLGTSLQVASRAGYTFQGWWTGTLTSTTVEGETIETVNYGAQITNPDGSLVAHADDGGVYISGGYLYLRSDATLYAKWTAFYNIAIWKENSTVEGQYDFAEVIDGFSAEIGSTVRLPEEYQDKDQPKYPGYKFNNEKSDYSKEIGNTKEITTLNVYYDYDGYESPGQPHSLIFKDSAEGSATASSDIPQPVSGISYKEKVDTYIPETDPTRKVDDKEVYTFAGWFLDKNCANEADLDNLLMPDSDLTLYAGWDPVKFRVDIDPNYGALYYYDDSGVLQGTGATYFNNSYDAEPIAEYTHVTRDYVESSSGSYYYVNHDRAYNGSDRFTYYTDNPSEATEDTTFEYAPGIYTYAGWYEVYLDADGNEIGEASEPYDFTQHTDHNTKLRLHWKKSGSYRLAYDAGDGYLEDGSKVLLLEEEFSDYAVVELDQTADAPDGYAFVGWKIRNSASQAIYRVNQAFTIRADDAIRNSGMEIVYLDAVYTKVGMASIVYDANGGTIDEDAVNYGFYPGEIPTAATGGVSGNRATVSGIANNSRFYLSNGSGFAYSSDDFEIDGWSNKQVYDPNDSSAKLFDLGDPANGKGLYGIDREEPIEVYAAWKTTVTYHLNNEDASWSHQGDTYTETVYLKNSITEPDEIPVYEGSGNILFRYWSTNPNSGVQYHFGTKVNSKLDLYAYWDEPDKVKIHAVDVSAAEYTEKTDWVLADEISVGTTEISLPSTEHVSVPADYEIAFVAAHDSSKSLDMISEEEKVVSIVYDSARKTVVVKDEDGKIRPLEEGEELYYVCFVKKALTLSYKSMASDGALTHISSEMTDKLGTYNMQEKITAPLDGTGYPYYAFAIGSEGATDASDLTYITNPSSIDTDRPYLSVRNSWQGFEYSTDGNNWKNCNYDPELYVIYYEQKPVDIIFREMTQGTQSVMSQVFEYNLKIMQDVKTTTSDQTQIKDEFDNWIDQGDPVEESNTVSTEIYDTEAEGNNPYYLSNGKQQSAILFYSTNESTEEHEDVSHRLKHVITTTIETSQTITIRQTKNDSFTTKIDDAVQDTEPYSWSYTSSAESEAQTVIYTNVHKSLPVEIHVARIEEDGENGIIRRDANRSADPADYSFDLEFGNTANLLNLLPADGVYDDPNRRYVFGMAISGSGAVADNQPVTVEQANVVSIAYEKIDEGVYELVLKDEGGNVIGELGSNDLYYLYYPMPQIEYAKLNSDGSLTPIKGSPYDESHVPVVSDAITYDHETITMNGKTVVQYQSFEVPFDGMTISQSGNNFRMPPNLDDGIYTRYLSYSKLGAGISGYDSLDDLGDNVSDDLTLQLKIEDNSLLFSFDGASWQNLPIDKTPTIYAIYTEHGYDLQISKTIDLSKSGDAPLFSEKTFPLVISSMAITKESYKADGAETDTISAIPASGSTPGRIEMIVEDGTKIRIKGLGQGDYTITESDNDNYELTAKSGRINSGSTSPIPVIDNSVVNLQLNNETRLDLTNSPKAICKINDGGVIHYFYTLQSAIDYVEENIASYTARVEMLVDYTLPAVDTVTIPTGFDITLTTAEEYSGSGKSTLTRSSELADKALFTNHGSLSFENIILEGNRIEASKPMIESSGDLELGRGTVVRNVINSAEGGAVYATAGDITINNAQIINNGAKEGGAIYYAGNGEINIAGTSKISNNVAADGNGGAIYAINGTIDIKGQAELSNNTAENGNGGAIYVNNAQIDIGQYGRVNNNTARNGGAIYAETGTITISETEGVNPPQINGNTANGTEDDDGNGGAIYIGTGSVEISGGSVSNNEAEHGNGGAIYANSATVSISGTAVVNNNSSAENGGSVYTVSGSVTVEGGEVNNNTANTNGGAIYSDSGTVALSGGSVSNNRTTEGDGGAVYTNRSNVVLSDTASVSSNTSYVNGGAIYSESGNITISSESLNSNTATTGKGGAVYANNGTVTINSTAIGDNQSGSDGGAIYEENGAVSISAASFTGNTSSGNGGAVYIGKGTTTINESTTMAGNEASENGGALYLDSGSVDLSEATMNNNTAVNGSAVFTKTGRVNFTNGSYSNNTSSNGGAVGVGDINARLYFAGDVTVSGNTLAGSTTKSNVYLDKDDDAIINIDTLTANAAIGIHVPDDLVDYRSVPGARFAFYSSNANVSKISNDRFPALSVQSDTGAKKLYWGNAIKVSVCYLGSFNPNYPPDATAQTNAIYSTTKYFPDINDGAISELANELYTKYGSTYSPKLSATAVYAGAFLDDAAGYGEYLTKLTWDSDNSRWMVTKRDGSTKSLSKSSGDHRIYIYYSEPAYISIENNTTSKLTITDMAVNNMSVINSDSEIGYGMLFAKNGAIREALLPVTATDLELNVGSSVVLLIPGGQGMAYTLEGGFESTAEFNSIRLRRTGLAETTLTLDGNKKFAEFNGTTLSNNGTYSIIFGDDKYICKVVDAGGTEHPYSKICDALAEIVSGEYVLPATKTAVIEMLTDYLLPASDPVNIPRGYDITLTTASKTEGTYRYNGEGNRAIISRDSENTGSMINSWHLDGKTPDTTLRINNLIFDGKSVRGSSDGGGLYSSYTNVYINNVEFKNVYASNGGALLVMFSAKDKNNKATVPGTVLQVENSNFIGCVSTTTETSNRLGGGAIVTNAETMTLKSCKFESCTAVDQAGAVFHRVDGNYTSFTNIDDCTFTNCQADAAGGLELDSKTITVTNSKFEHCVALQRNGGGFNVWALNAEKPTADCYVTVENCVFNDCQLTTTNTSRGNGGGFRSNAVYTTVKNSTFTNNTALYGGGFCVSNENAKKAEILGCTFERNTANQGGGIFVKAKEFIIGDYEPQTGEIRHTEIKNCTSNNEGAGIYHYNEANGTSLSITNAVISGNQNKNSGKNGGGVYSNARSTGIIDSSIIGNKATGNGGGVWFDANNDNARANMVLTVKGSKIDGNTSNGSGGGIYTLAKTVNVSGSDTQVDDKGKPVSSSISDNNATTNGGGIYQNRNIDGSSLNISNAVINGNTASNTNTSTDNGGGGIHARVRTLNITDSEVSNNTSKSNGGGVLFEINSDDARANMTLIVNGSVFDNNTSNANGGSIYTRAKTVEISEYYEDDEMIQSKISNSTAAYSGGGLYQNRDIEGSSLVITNSVISGCHSNDSSSDMNPPRGGGGVMANVRTITVTDSEISNNSAVRNGGGIDAPANSSDYNLVVENSEIKGNSAGNQGGGIYTRSQLTLRKGTKVTNNRLTSGSINNAAGVYLIDGRTLYVGYEGATEDSVYVKENYTSSGNLSNLRLWESSNVNNENSVYVYCDLSDDSEVYVVNAKKVGTKFGHSLIPDPNGFSDDLFVFKADTSTLHGIIDRTDSSRLIIIWAGPPIAKITAADGQILYLKDNGTSPAIFDRLYEGGSGDYNTVGAFNMLNSETPELYLKNGRPYTGTEFIVKMLVESYTNEKEIHTMDVPGRKITFTTAGTGEDEGDYRYEGKAGGRATVYRGNGVGNHSMFHASTEILFKSIILDGNSDNITVNSETRLLDVSSNGKTVTLGSDATLQNAKITDKGGGAVNIATNGKFVIDGGTIRNCVAKYGGGIYINGSAELKAGNIYRCYATENGGGVNAVNGNFTMTGGSISYCGLDENDNPVTKNGGGVYLVKGRNLNMSAGSIINNASNTSGGGVAIDTDLNGNNGSKLNFSGKVNISGNTSVKDGATVNNNIEMNRNSKTIINTNNGGLLPGSYIGIYVPGNRDDDVPENDTDPYKTRGGELDAFGTFVNGDNTTNLYCFVNDRNGLKGGIKENPDPYTIYWIKIFSLTVSKTVEAGLSNPYDESEQFSFTVNLRNSSSIPSGQRRAEDIDGEYGEMVFHSNGRDTTTATFTLKAGETITAVNLSQGLTYEVIEEFGGNQVKKNVPVPGESYSGLIGENKDRRDIDPYTSVVDMTNIQPICKITNENGQLLYKQVIWHEKTIYIPAAYTELSGENGAFEALNGKLYSTNGNNPPVYSGSVQIQMLVENYYLRETVNLPNTKTVILTTANKADTVLPYQGDNSTAAINRSFANGSMFDLNGRLTLVNVSLNGMKAAYVADSDGGIVKVKQGGTLNIQMNASLINSRTSLKGGAVFVENRGKVTMNGGTVDGNESVDEGAGIYLSEGSRMEISGNPNFGGNGLDRFGNIITGKGNCRDGELIAKTNGRASYEKARQDIFIEGYAGDHNVSSLIVVGDINCDPGTIWVWAGSDPHYKIMEQFAGIEGALNDPKRTGKAFRNAQDDDKALNQTQDYLYGNQLGGDTANFRWSGNDDTRYVILRKVYKSGKTFESLADAVFTLYYSNATATVKVDGIELKDMTSLSSGVIWTGELPYGTYYLQETTVPSGYNAYVGQSNWYKIEVDEDGVVSSGPLSSSPKT